MRIALGIEYDGTAYNGWQRQQTGAGIQPHLENALSQVAGEAIDVTCAGRTDTGVHAAGQVVHFDTSSERSSRSWLLGANSSLPSDINVTWAKAVSEDFHARFSAVSRTYRYLILNRLQRSALYRNRAWWVHQPLEASRMDRAARLLRGKHDFSAFRAAGCQAATPIREISDISVHRQNDWIALQVTANAFLQRMVRNIAGTLVAVGSGAETEQWVADVLQSRDRKQGGAAAPPQGLTLVSVAYPVEFGLPANPIYRD